MALADSKVLALGALVGVAGIGLACMYYREVKAKRKVSWPHYYGNSTSNADVMLADGLVIRHGQVEVLQRLEALMQCVSELKDEMKALKNALPTLQDQVREEFRGQSGSEGGTHRARTTPTRRKRTSVISRSGAHSSEDAESEGG